MRLNKFLARAGLDSRRKCDELIKNQKISINGSVVTDFSYQVKDDDVILFNGKYVEISDHPVVYVLNKPKGYICTSKDLNARLKVVDLIETNLRLFTIGRLDRDTTGIILLTNDGDICNYLTHPKYSKEKKYYVKTKGKIENLFLNKIKDGYVLEDGLRVKADIKLISKTGQNFEWDVVLREGKNREIKRIFSNFDAQVVLLHRYSFSGLELRKLNSGKYRKLSKEEIRKLIK